MTTSQILTRTNTEKTEFVTFKSPSEKRRFCFWVKRQNLAETQETSKTDVVTEQIKPFQRQDNQNLWRHVGLLPRSYKPQLPKRSKKRLSSL